MEQKKLYRTLELFANENFETEEQMLKTLLGKIIEDKEISVKGGRIWKLDLEKKAYKLLFQAGSVDKIQDNYMIYLVDYPIFDLIAKERTILTDETNAYLRKKGIFKYSASGIGSKKKIDNKLYYEYLLALNSDSIDDNLRYTLNIIATFLTAQLKQRRLALQQQNYQEEFIRAKQLQKSILPEHEYKFGNYELYGITLPADYVAGDFFDYITDSDTEERLAVAIGDAASKGISAAAEAFYISGALRMAATFQIKVAPLMKRMNELVNKIFSDDKFTSLFYGELTNNKRGLMYYCNAGHNPPVFIKAKTKEIFYLEATGPVLGPSPKAKYETDYINFNCGDVLAIYTDGISEAMNKNEELFEENKRLEKLLLDSIDKTPKEIAIKIIDEVVKFSANAPYTDDKTIVVIKRIK